MDATTIFLGFIFGTVGMGYLVYGRKSARLLPLLAGLGLCVLPYLVTEPLPLVLLGGLLAGLPFFL